MTLRISKTGAFPQYSEICIGTTAEIEAYAPNVEVATASATDTGVGYSWNRAKGSWTTGNADATTGKSATALPIGYDTGTGGQITQGTGRTTAVTLNKLAGLITLFPATLAAATGQSFALNNTNIAAGDMVLVQHQNGGTQGLYNFSVVTGAGTATITVRNNSAGASPSEAPVLQFFVLKAAVA
jgi:hypothetical protein